MGLRGLTVLIASGDDGIGNLIVRKNPKVGCSRAWPDWPASSAYVTAVGATQLSDTYLPACTATYVPEPFTFLVVAYGHTRGLPPAHVVGPHPHSARLFTTAPSLPHLPTSHVVLVIVSSTATTCLGGCRTSSS